MQKLLFALVLFCTPAAASAKGSIGILASTPEIFGGYLSMWPSNDLTIDFRATLSTLDAGVTGHLAMARAPGHRHDLALSALGGWLHGGPRYYDDAAGGHLAALAGYGYQGALDIRLQGGVSAYPGKHEWLFGPTFVASLGWIF